MQQSPLHSVARAEAHRNADAAAVGGHAPNNETAANTDADCNGPASACKENIGPVWNAKVASRPHARTAPGVWDCIGVISPGSSIQVSSGSAGNTDRSTAVCGDQKRTPAQARVQRGALSKSQGRDMAPVTAQPRSVELGPAQEWCGSSHVQSSRRQPAAEPETMRGRGSQALSTVQRLPKQEGSAEQDVLLLCGGRVRIRSCSSSRRKPKDCRATLLSDKSSKHGRNNAQLTKPACKRQQGAWAESLRGSGGSAEAQRRHRRDWT